MLRLCLKIFPYPRTFRRLHGCSWDPPLDSQCLCPIEQGRRAILLCPELFHDIAGVIPMVGGTSFEVLRSIGQFTAALLTCAQQAGARGEVPIAVLRPVFSLTSCQTIGNLTQTFLPCWMASDPCVSSQDVCLLAYFAATRAHHAVYTSFGSLLLCLCARLQAGYADVNWFHKQTSCCRQGFESTPARSVLNDSPFQG